MLIITADDYGKNTEATDAIIHCYKNKRITSASAMVSMADSKRAASLALETSLEVGLHLNFTLPFNEYGVSRKLNAYQEKLVSYLAKHKLAQILVNPFLSDAFHNVCKAQREEFVRLYGREPEFYNGHHHMHLCSNVLASGSIPRGAKVRGTFTFDPGEKNSVNLFYRHMLEKYVSKKFVSTDSFFSVAPVQDHERVRQIINRAGKETVELEVHPENQDETEFLLSDEFGELVGSVQLGRFSDL